MMPASGLTLSEVGYPADDQLAVRAAASRRRREPHEAQNFREPAQDSEPDETDNDE